MVNYVYARAVWILCKIIFFVYDKVLGQVKSFEYSAWNGPFTDYYSGEDTWMNQLDNSHFTNKWKRIKNGEIIHYYADGGASLLVGKIGSFLKEDKEPSTGKLVKEALENFAQFVSSDYSCLAVDEMIDEDRKEFRKMVEGLDIYNIDQWPNTFKAIYGEDLVVQVFTTDMTVYWHDANWKTYWSWKTEGWLAVIEEYWMPKGYSVDVFLDAGDNCKFRRVDE